MQATDDVRPKRWFDGYTPQDHIRDAAHLLARLIMLLTSAGCL